MPNITKEYESDLASETRLEPGAILATSVSQMKVWNPHLEEKWQSPGISSTLDISLTASQRTDLPLRVLN